MVNAFSMQYSASFLDWSNMKYTSPIISWKVRANENGHQEPILHVNDMTTAHEYTSNIRIISEYSSHDFKKIPTRRIGAVLGKQN